jgi:osmotically inducible protein OsmC
LISSSRRAEALVAKAHQVCPYSNATRNNIDVKLTVE